MENVSNNKTAIYWIVGIVVVIALFLGIRYWGGNSEIVTNTENNTAQTQDTDLNDYDDTNTPTDDTTKTPNTPVENPVNNFDYKG